MTRNIRRIEIFNKAPLKDSELNVEDLTRRKPPLLDTTKIYCFQKRLEVCTEIYQASLDSRPR